MYGILYYNGPRKGAGVGTPAGLPDKPRPQGSDKRRGVTMPTGRHPEEDRSTVVETVEIIFFTLNTVITRRMYNF